MTDFLIDKFKAKYPDQFQDYLRGRDVEIPPGWVSLVEEMVDEFCTKYPSIRFRQIKEKFGELRVYESFANSILDDEAESISSKLDKYVERSVQICCVCGSDKEVDRDPGYWISYSCKEHRRKASEQ